MPKPTPPAAYAFSHHPASAEFTVPSQKYISDHPSTSYQHLATGALVFNHSGADVLLAGPRVLLLQRAASDSMPGRWEVPGGGVDDDDASILHAVARELWEEAGLTAVGIGEPIGSPCLFASRSGKRICKFSFLVFAARKASGGGLAEDVVLDADEHQRFVWASEEEVRAGKAGEMELVFTTAEMEATVLEAFRVMRTATRSRGDR